MKVSFESPLEDFVDVARKSAGTKRAFYSNVFAVAIGYGGLIGLVLYFVFRSVPIAVISFAVTAAYVVISNLSISKRNIQKSYKQHFGTDDPIMIEVEITEAGLTFKQGAETITREWSSVESVEESDEAIYFHLRNKIVSAVRKRGFVSESEMEEFLRRSRTFIRDASLPPPPTFSE